MVVHGSKVRRADRAWKERLVLAEHIEPIGLPLDPDREAAIIGIAPKAAWMPLAIAIVQRLRRVWNLIADSHLGRVRIAGDEHLYQVLRLSLFNLREPLDGMTESHELIAELIPDRLPASSDLVRYNYDAMQRQNDAFERLEQVLIQDAVWLGSTPDTRTVEELLESFDLAVERLALARDEDALARLAYTNLSDEAQERLEGSIRERRCRLRFGPGQELVFALAILDRLGELWALLDPDGPDYRRFRRDEDVYQTYRYLLLASLDPPEYEPVLELAQSSIPRLLPDAGDPLPRNLFGDDVPAAMARLRHEIIALAHRYRLTTMLDLEDEETLDDWFPEAGAAWTRLQTTIRRARQGTEPAGPVAAPAANGTRTGRRPKAITYEYANAVWWDLIDELAPEKPTYEMLCDRLTELGLPIRPRTFTERCRDWRQKGQDFPGPRPDPAAESAETANP